MRILLATGIYPPDIGGPATYVRELAGRLQARGAEVMVLAYGEEPEPEGKWPVIRVSKRGGPLFRWWRYRRELRELGKHCDIVYAFSAVSVGMPLLLSRLRGPRRVLRLGGDFGWERATDRGETATLSEWYERPNWVQRRMHTILRTFDYIVFSSAFQEELYERYYSALPVHSVIENALPDQTPVLHHKHEPLKLLFLGRFVAFKNLPALIDALTLLPRATLTLIGDGPVQPDIESQIDALHLSDRVTIQPPAQGQDKQTVFLGHDLLILPSLTEISPNVALEARSAGLPILLTEETGLSISLRQGMMVTELRTPEQIARAVQNADAEYDVIAARAAAALPERPWDKVADEHIALFRGLL